MELHQLRCFVTVAEELHFARAADRLGTTQSGISRTIQALEDDLGARLFNRSKRSSVSLTSTGAIFLPEAKLVLQQAERSEAIARRAGRGELGRLEIGYVASAALSGTVSRIVRGFRELAPNVDMQLHELETPRQLEDIAQGRIDIGFIRARTRYPVEVKAVKLQQDTLVVAMQAEHPIASKPEILPKDLAGFRFIVPYFGEESGFMGQLEALALAGGFPLPAIEPARDFLTVLTAVAAGLGFGLVPASVSNMHVPGSALREVSGIELSSDLMLATRRAEGSPAVRRFLAHALRN